MRRRVVRKRVRRIEPASVLRLSLVAYLAILVVIVVAASALWGIAVAFGAIHSIDRGVEQLFGYRSFRLEWLQVLGAAVAIGAVLVIIGTLANVIAALAYNLASGSRGGVAVMVEEDETAVLAAQGQSPARPVAAPVAGRPAERRPEDGGVASRTRRGL